MPKGHRPTRRRLTAVAAVAAALLVSLSAIQAADAKSGRATLGGASTLTTACPDGWFEMESHVGVADCRLIGQNNDWNLTIINPEEGGRIRVVSQWDDQSPEAPSPNARFHRKTAEEWADHILDNQGPALPAPSNLTHVFNAGFLISDNEESTPLSLPEKRSGGFETHGYAMEHTEDWAYGWPDKRAIMLGYPGYSDGQASYIEKFPGYGGSTTGYNLTDVNDSMGSQWYYDALVGYGPNSAPSDGDQLRRRVFFLKQTKSVPRGVPPRNYLLTTSSATLADVNAKINELNASPSFQVETWERVQLDGGASQQRYSVATDNWWHGLVWRRVPEVLAIYHG